MVLTKNQKIGFGVGAGVLLVVIGIVLYFVFIKTDTPKPTTTSKPTSTSNPISTSKPIITNPPIQPSQAEMERASNVLKAIINKNKAAQEIIDLRRILIKQMFDLRIHQMNVVLLYGSSATGTLAEKLETVNDSIKARTIASNSAKLFAEKLIYVTQMVIAEKSNAPLALSNAYTNIIKDVAAMTTNINNQVNEINKKTSIDAGEMTNFDKLSNDLYNRIYNDNLNPNLNLNPNNEYFEYVEMLKNAEKLAIHMAIAQAMSIIQKTTLQNENKIAK